MLANTRKAGGNHRRGCGWAAPTLAHPKIRRVHLGIPQGRRAHKLMAAYLIRRLWQMIPTLLGVVLLVFFLFKYFGGDPAELLGGLNASPEQVKAIRQQLGLDEPMWE